MTTKQFLKYTAITIAVIFTLSVIVYGVRWVTAPAKGRLEKRETIESGSFRRYSYEHFYDLCASIQRKERMVKSQSEVEDRRKDNRLAAIKSELQSAVSQYNADVRKEDTVGAFKANNLPEHIEYNPEEITQCD